MWDEINFGQKVILAILGITGTSIGAILLWLGVSGKNRIDAGKTAHDAAINIINELQEERKLLKDEREAFHTERISFQKERSEWNSERADYRLRLLNCEGQTRGMEQYIQSLEALLRAQGLDIPRKRTVEPIFVFDNAGPTGL